MSSQRRPQTDKPLRVALDATPLLTERSGVGEFCTRALQVLGAMPSLDVSAFAISWRRRHGVVAHLPEGVTVLGRPMPARPLHVAWSHVPFPPVELFLGAVDVVHGTNFVVPPAYRAATVVSVHDLTPVRYPELVEPAVLAFPRLIRNAVRRGAWVHTPSQHVAQEVVDVFDVPPERVRAVHHGLVPPVVTTRGKMAARDLLPSWAGRYVLAVGTVEPRKDLPTLVKSFAAVCMGRPDLALVIAGSERWGKEQLDDAVGLSPAAARIIRLGRVDGEVRDALLAGAAVLAFPSLYEGFGFPPLEAMAVGTPVVATRCGALEEVLGSAAVFVDVRDPDGLAAAIAELLDDTALREDRIALGRERAALYTWEACGAGLAALYRDAHAAHG